jgi:predicted Zn-dependent protease
MSASRQRPRHYLSGFFARDQKSRATKPQRDRARLFLRRARPVVCVVAMAMSAISLAAQGARSDLYTPRFGMGAKPNVTVVQGSNVDTKQTVSEESCFPWNLSEARTATVSAARLKVPAQATREYKGACDAFVANNFSEAEQHARGAIGKYQNYSAAWVLLGMILVGQQKAQDARDACSHAATIDASYFPAYLCEAEISVRSQQWKEVLTSMDQALAVQPQGNAYPFYYRAKAYLRLNNLPEAKKNALQALDIDVNHYEPSLYFVLAQIYDREGDKANAIAQLQELLKHNPDATQEDIAKQFLARLHSQQSPK